MIMINTNTSTTVWLHTLDFNEMPGEKVRQEVCKDAEYCFQ